MTYVKDPLSSKEERASVERMTSWALRTCALGVALVTMACDGDNTPPSFFDSGTDATLDGAADGPDGAATTHAKIIVVHASPDLGAIRLCLAVGTQNDGSDAVVVAAPPIPKGLIAPGGGVVLPDVGDLSGEAVTPYAVLSASIGTSTQTCDTLVKNLVVGTDYFVLPTIKRLALVPNATFMLAVTGCVRAALDSAADATTCGPTYNATTGNVSASLYTLDQVITNSQRFGAQVVHAAAPTSGSWYTLFGTHGLNALLRPFDGGADEIIATSMLYQQLAPPNAASLAMPAIDQTAFVISADNADAGGATSIPLPLVYEATTGQVSGENAYFVAGVNYTFVVVGDPRAPTTFDGGVLNGYALHALAFPNNPVVPSQ
jgi:hypothetical protein